MLKEVSVNTIVYYSSKLQSAESTNHYKITLQYTSISNIKWMEEFINKGNNSYEINVEKRMSRKIFGITSAIRDNIQKGDSDN